MSLRTVQAFCGLCGTAVRAMGFMAYSCVKMCDFLLFGVAVFFSFLSEIYQISRSLAVLSTACSHLASLK